MGDTRKKSPARRVLKVFLLGGLAIVLLFGALFAWVATRPDAPPFDDSAMLPQRPHVPAGQNGYDALIKVVGDMKSSSEDSYGDLKELRASKAPDLSAMPEAKIQALTKKYGARYEAVQRALDLPYFVAPPRRINQKEPKYIVVGDFSTYGLLLTWQEEPNYIAVRDFSTYGLLLAWQEVRAGRAHDALNHLDDVMKQGSALEKGHGNFLTLMIGIAIKTRALQEIDAMLNKGMLPADALPGLALLFDDRDAPAEQNWTRAVKHEYEFSKYIAMHMSDLYEGGGSAVWTRLQSRFLWKPNQVLQAEYPYFVDLAGIIREPYSESSAGDLETRVRHDSQSLPLSWRMFLHPSGEMGKFLMCTAMPNFARAGDRYILFRVQWRLMQTRIAALRYHADHGAFPPDLAALVPDYLPAVPTDPMDGKPLRYNAEKKLVYSVGYDLKDDGGRAKAYALDRKVEFKARKEQKDIVLRIGEPEKGEIDAIDPAGPGLRPKPGSAR